MALYNVSFRVNPYGDDRVISTSLIYDRPEYLKNTQPWADKEAALALAKYYADGLAVGKIVVSELVSDANGEAQNKTIWQS